MKYFETHCQICNLLVNPDAKCNHQAWENSLCVDCGERCFHPTFSGCSCNVCDYVSDGVENPIFVTFKMTQYIVPSDMTVRDFIVNILNISYEESLIDGYWEWIGQSTSMYLIPEGAKLSDLGYRYISIAYRLNGTV